MEFFDVVNEADEVIGQATREECHANPQLIHRPVHFTLIDKTNKTIFLTRRSYSKETDPGKICFLGEHLTAGETWEQGLIRGLSEELHVSPISFIQVGQHLFKLPKQTELARFYLVEIGDQIPRPGKGEVAETQWVKLQTLLSDTSNYSDTTKYWAENTDWEKVFTASII